MYKRKRIVIALGGNALGNTLPEQMQAVKTTARALCDLIEEGHQVVVVHGNGPQVGMINNAMAALSREDENQPNTPLSVCVAMSQAYIGYDLQNALREELRKRGFMRTPVVTVVTQVRVDANDPAFQNPSKPIGHFMTKEQVNTAFEHFFGIKNADVCIKGLTAGDFATVKKKATFLCITDLGELYKMLEDEVKVKKSKELQNSVGF